MRLLTSSSSRVAVAVKTTDRDESVHHREIDRVLLSRVKHAHARAQESKRASMSEQQSVRERWRRWPRSSASQDARSCTHALVHSQIDLHGNTRSSKQILRCYLGSLLHRLAVGVSSLSRSLARSCACSFMALIVDAHQCRHLASADGESLPSCLLLAERCRHRSPLRDQTQYDCCAR